MNCKYQLTEDYTNSLVAFYIGNVNHNYGYDRHFPNIYVDNLLIDDSKIKTKDYLYIIQNDQKHTDQENGYIQEVKDENGNTVYFLPEEITIKNYKTTKGLAKIKFLYNEISTPIKFSIGNIQIETQTNNTNVIKVTEETTIKALISKLSEVEILGEIQSNNNIANIATGDNFIAASGKKYNIILVRRYKF